jgi:hypothetical protein
MRYSTLWKNFLPVSQFLSYYPIKDIRNKCAGVYQVVMNVAPIHKEEDAV